MVDESNLQNETADVKWIFHTTERRKNTDPRDDSLMSQNILTCFTHYTTCAVFSKVHSLPLIKAILRRNV